ncbi:MAG: FG-GAP repeat protein [Phycisphaerae bacterium]
MRSAALAHAAGVAGLAKRRAAGVLAMAAGMALVVVPSEAAAQCSSQEATKLTAADAAPGDHFGTGVDLSGDLLVVGAVFDDDACPADPECQSGSAYVYRREGAGWIQEVKLTASDALADDWFGLGESVSVGTDRAVIGALGQRGVDAETGAIIEDAGAAYAYTRFADSFPCETAADCEAVGLSVCTDGACEGVAWVEEAKLNAADPVAETWFGRSVSVDREVVAIGAYEADGDALFTGAAYMFRRYSDSFPCETSEDCVAVGLTTCTDNVCDGLAWVEEAKLAPSDGQALDWFGFSVSFDTDVVVIGAPLASPNCCFGHAGVGCEQAACQGSVCAADAFCCDTQWDGICANLAQGICDTCGSGTAYVYRNVGGNWVAEGKLIANDAATDDFFGWSVRVRGDVAIVGAYGDDGAGPDSGAAYVFRFNGGSWVEEAVLTAADAAVLDWFGYSVSISGDVAIVGALLDDDDDGALLKSGSAHVYYFDGSTWAEQVTPSASDNEAGDRFGRSVAVLDGVAVVGAYLDDDACVDNVFCNSGSVYTFGGLTDCNDNDTLDACDIASGDSQDENGDGVPDECQLRIVSSDPPDGAIDARQPSEPDGSNADGWDAIAVTFTGDTSALTPADFVVTLDPPGAAPSITEVSAAGDTITLTFDSFIPVAAWTIVTHTESDTSVRIGYLPADVNNDRMSNANDILALIDALNGVGEPLAAYQTDIDRGGASNPNDILRTIDLLNGAGDYDEFLGASLPE